jgi:protease-4
MIERVLLAGIEEQRRSRRWRIFFRLSGLSTILLVLLMSVFWGGMGGSSSGGGRHTALVEIKGVIGSEGDASADAITESLRAAFDDPQTAGVLIRINSPGGSPVQSGIVYHEIRRLRAKHPATPVHVVVEEICASGGYYVAAAADKIFVDRASLIGSIGVLMDNFGFVEALRKLGIERRVMTAGENKAFLDAFSPMDERQRAHAQKLLDEIHAQFIEAVRAGRGNRIVDSPEIFSGLIWSGARSIELGLADGLGSVNQVAREVIGAERVVDFSRKEDFADKLARRLGTEGARSFSEALSAAISAVRFR